MLGMGWMEIFLILMVALFVIGPERLPEVARGVVRMIRQIQRLLNEIRNSVRLEELQDPLSNHHTEAHYTSRPKPDAVSPKPQNPTPEETKAAAAIGPVAPATTEAPQKGHAG